MDDKTPVRHTYADISRAFSEELSAKGLWCGFPMVIPGLALTLAPGYAFTEEVEACQRIVDEEHPEDLPPTEVTCDEDDLTWRLVNSWYSRREQRTIGIATNGTSYEAFRMDKHDHVRRLDLTFNTFKAHEAWVLDAEVTAMGKLRHLIKPHLFSAYMLTGMFVETSPRSRLVYIFRRLRPTVVVAFHEGAGTVLCTLCLHPIGYYEASFAGSMVPTDEVIAHLLLMRADEHLYWKRANQHEPWMPESGL